MSGFRITKKQRSQMREGLKKLQPVIAEAERGDINEADTVTIVKDIFEDVLGYDKYSEITSEHEIKKSYCDIAVILNKQLKLLVEVKAIGVNTLKEGHIRQAVNYGANKGVEWVVLTNAKYWNLYKIAFGKPISFEKIFSIDMTSLNLRKDSTYDQLYVLTHHGMMNNALTDRQKYHTATNRYTISALLLSPAFVKKLRVDASRMLKKMDLSAMSSNIKDEDILAILEEEILSRSVRESEEFHEAKKIVRRFQNKMQRAKREATLSQSKSFVSLSTPSSNDPSPDSESKELEIFIDKIAS